MLHTSQQIHQLLTSAEKTLIVIHQNPDGDAVGSISALAEYLFNLDRNLRLFCPTAVPPKLQFLPHAHLITNKKEILKDSVDLIVVLDSGDLRYAGIDDLAPNHPATLINIDHHPTNEKYGHINLLNPTASSTTEILYHFFKENGININHNMATALLAGIINDTDNFVNPATSEIALNVASDLLRRGANLNLIHNWTIKNKTISILKLWGVVLGRLEKKENLDMAYTYLTKKDILQYDIADDSETDGIANFLNKLDGAKISLLMKETPEGKIKGSFRTTREDVDVSAIAKKMGGGGHKKASGFTAEGTIAAVLQKIIDIQKK